ncbi:MAG: ABC-2 family transporter protein, partial [Planctomycetaceae bacterium]
EQRRLRGGSRWKEIAEVLGLETDNLPKEIDELLWFGRNQGLYDFWFYLTIFAQYPRSIYNRSSAAAEFEAGEMLQFTFSWVVPILLVVTVPARTLAGMAVDWRFAAATLVSTLLCIAASRMVFRFALSHYRGASS